MCLYFVQSCCRTLFHISYFVDCQVSLATSSKKETTGDSPLQSLEEECARHFGLDIGDNVAVTVGSFFAFAVVFPSCKV